MRACLFVLTICRILLLQQLTGCSMAAKKTLNKLPGNPGVLRCGQGQTGQYTGERRGHGPLTTVVGQYASCQPAEFVIPNGGGFWRWACPLKLKKMAHMHRHGKRIVACSACAVAKKRECARMLIAAGGHFVSCTQHGEGKKRS